MRLRTSASRTWKSGFRAGPLAAQGSIAPVNFDQLLVALSLNGNETPRGDHSRYASNIIWSYLGLSGVKWPYVGKIMDTSEVSFAASSGT